MNKDKIRRALESANGITHTFPVGWVFSDRGDKVIFSAPKDGF